MAPISKASILSCVSIFIFQYLFASGFTTDLIHRDSPLSPNYDPSLSRSERLHNAIHRSFSRAANSFAMRTTSDSSGAIDSGIMSNGGEYLMKLSIGTPPIKTLAIADTGSDLAWIQCKPCTQCFDQNTSVFEPSVSSTYRNLDCKSKQCNALDVPSCGGNNTCQYRVTYGDRSSSQGDLAVDTFGFTSSSGQKSIYVLKVVFGCGHDNEGMFNGSGEGIIGLGGGPFSLVNQMKTFVNGTFSYCLVPIGSPENVTSKLKFGSDALVSGPGAVSTPLVSKEPVTFYYLTLESISVGDKKLAYMKTNLPKSMSSSTVEEGNIIIDSGTTLTLLPNEFYQNLETALEQSIKGKRVTDPSGQLSLCYQVDGNIQFPNIIFHFTDADIELKSTSTFLEVKAGTVCLTLVPSDDLAIFGNLSQMDFLVGYDLVAKKVSFLPTDCTKQ